MLGYSSSQRINTMVTDVVMRTLEGDLTEVRMSDEVLQATLALRGFLFEAVYENPRATAEFEKAAGILGGLWENLRARPEQYLDRSDDRAEGLDAAARDFLAGMTDRYAVSAVPGALRAAILERLVRPRPPGGARTGEASRVIAKAVPASLASLPRFPVVSDTVSRANIGAFTQR